MKDLYHIICVNTRSGERAAVLGMSDKKIDEWDLVSDIGNGPAFNILQCKRLVALEKEFDKDEGFLGICKYEIVPATKKE